MPPSPLEALRNLLFLPLSPLLLFQPVNETKYPRYPRNVPGAVVLSSSMKKRCSFEWSRLAAGSFLLVNQDGLQRNSFSECQPVLLLPPSARARAFSRISSFCATLHDESNSFIAMSYIQIPSVCLSCARYSSAEFRRSRVPVSALSRNSNWKYTVRWLLLVTREKS